MTRRLAALSLAVVTAGCAGLAPPSTPTLKMSTGAAESEYAAYRSAGTATMSGQASARLRGGDVRHGAQATVTLDPATAYALEWHNKIGTLRDRFEEMPPEGRMPPAPEPD